MNSFKNKNIIVTGASKGLGKTISIEFEKLGSNIALIARSRNLLDDLKKFKEKDKHLFYDIDLMNDNERNKCLNDIEKNFKTLI